MERDPQLSKFIRESGVETVPEGFSRGIMEMISAEPEKKKYKPLIGRGGRIMIILFVVGMIVLSLVYSEPGGRILENTEILSNLHWQMPEFKLRLDFLADINFPTGILAALLAVFILVLSDAGFSKRRFVM